MQAGQARTKKWVLEFEPRWATEIEPLMGWTSSRDTLQQVKLTFPSKERAVAFAERRGWPYTVIEPHEPRNRPKSYADNFRWQHSPAASTVQNGQARDRHSTRMNYSAYSAYRQQSPACHKKK